MRNRSAKSSCPTEGRGRLCEERGVQAHGGLRKPTASSNGRGPFGARAVPGPVLCGVPPPVSPRRLLLTLPLRSKAHRGYTTCPKSLRLVAALGCEPVSVYLTETPALGFRQAERCQGGARDGVCKVASYTRQQGMGAAREERPGPEVGGGISQMPGRPHFKGTPSSGPREAASWELDGEEAPM